MPINSWSAAVFQVYQNVAKPSQCTIKTKNKPLHLNHSISNNIDMKLQLNVSESFICMYRAQHFSVNLKL